MNEKLRQKIKEFNRIGYQDNSNRIIVCTLKPVENVTIDPNSTKQSANVTKPKKPKPSKSETYCISARAYNRRT